MSGGKIEEVYKTYVFMADRRQLFDKRVNPALKAGQIVISNRSFISSMVYQCHDSYSAARLALAHDFVTWPDYVILYDLDAETAIARIKQRAKHHRGDYQTPEQLAYHRKRYLEVCKQYFPGQHAVISATLPIEKIASQTWEALAKSGVLGSFGQ